MSTVSVVSSAVRSDKGAHGEFGARVAGALGQGPRWGCRWLVAAGIYNLAWGALAIAMPNRIFDWAGMAPLNHPQVWQCLGMVIRVYGIGYLIAAHDHRRHWPIVFVGLLGKIFGPIGFAIGWWRGELPGAFGVTLITNDLIWWVPFALMLRDAAMARRESKSSA